MDSAVGRVKSVNASSHILQSFDGLRLWFASVAVHPFLLQPSRTMQIYCLANLLSVSFYTFHCSIHAKKTFSFLGAVNASKQTKKHRDAFLLVFNSVSSSDTCPILTHFEMRTLSTPYLARLI